MASSSLSVASSSWVGRHDGCLLQERDGSLASISFRGMRLSLPSPSPSITRRGGGLALRASAAVAAPVEEAVAPPRLRLMYAEKVVPALKEEFKYANSLEVPRVVKVVVNCGVGEAAQNAKTLESTIKDLSLVTGQKPVITRAKKAIAGFKIRKDVPVGTCVTLRGEVMFSFLDRLINLALPRTRDFQGVNPYSFDGKGNYNLGMKEQSVFPEIKFDTIDQPRGMDISIFTTAKTDKEGQKLLTLLGMPFRDSKTIVRAPVVRKKKGGKYSSKGNRKK